MAYHINPANGKPGVCRAQKACPFGDLAADHYPTPEAAREAFEKSQSFPKPHKKKYPEYTRDESMAIAQTIKRQIGPLTLMSLGASDFHGIKGGMRFRARILPFNADGVRSERPAAMYVEVKLNGSDYYDVQVHHVKGASVILHHSEDDVSADQLSNTLFALDYDGPTARNPRI